MNYINQLPDEYLIPIFGQCGQIGKICQVSKKWNLLGEHIKNSWFQTLFDTRLNQRDSDLEGREIIWFKDHVGLKVSPFLKSFLIHQFSYFESLWGSVHNFSYQEHVNHSLDLDDIDFNNFEQMVKVTYEKKGQTPENIDELLKLGSRFGSPQLSEICDPVLAKVIFHYTNDDENFNKLVNCLEENYLGKRSQKIANVFLQTFLSKCNGENKEKFLTALDQLKGCFLDKLTLVDNSGNVQRRDLKKVTKITFLKSLELISCDKLKNKDLGVLSKLSSLKSLSLVQSLGITDGVVPFFYELNTLNSLNLTNCWQITDKGMPALVKISSLTSLVLNMCYKITDEGLPFIVNLPSLTLLDLSLTGVTDKAMPDIAKLTSLTTLRLFGCNITDIGVKSFENLTSLTSLGIGGKGITSEGMRSLEHLTSLTELDLCSYENSLLSLLKLDLLKILNLEGSSITDDDLLTLAKLPSLTSLGLRETLITDQGIPYFENFISLKKLDLQLCKISAEGKKSLKKLGMYLLL